MKKLFTLCLGTALLALSAASFAYPSLFGPTGSATLPTADTVGKGCINLAADYYNTECDPSYPVRAEVGLGSFEAGVLYDFNKGANVEGANAKFKIPIGNSADVGLGALYTNTLGSSMNVTTGYLVYTQYFTPKTVGTGFRASIGADWTRVHFGPDDHISKIRGFASADYRFTNGLMLSAEYQTKNNSFGEPHPLTSFVARYPFNNNIAIEAGVSNVTPNGLLAGEDHRFFAGIDFAFGKCGMKPGEKVMLICP